MIFIYFYIRIRTTVQHINALDDPKFKKLLQRVAEKTGRHVKYSFI
jgi:hypothetical protein